MMSEHNREMFTSLFIHDFFYCQPQGLKKCNVLSVCDQNEEANMEV